MTRVLIGCFAVCISGFLLAFTYLSATFFVAGYSQESEFRRCQTVLRGGTLRARGTVTQFSGPVFDDPNRPKAKTVGYSFASVDGRLFAGSQTIREGDFKRGDPLEIEYAKLDPIVSQIQGSELGVQGGKPILIIVGILWGLFGLNILFANIRRSPGTIPARLAAFTLFGAAIALGITHPFFAQSNGPRSLQIGTNVYRLDTGFSGTLDGKAIEFSNGTLHIDGKDFGQMPWHAHVRVDGTSVVISHPTP